MTPFRARPIQGWLFRNRIPFTWIPKWYRQIPIHKHGVYCLNRNEHTINLCARDDLRLGLGIFEFGKLLRKGLIIPLRVKAKPLVEPFAPNESTLTSYRSFWFWSVSMRSIALNVLLCSIFSIPKAGKGNCNRHPSIIFSFSRMLITNHCLGITLLIGRLFTTPLAVWLPDFLRANAWRRAMPQAWRLFGLPPLIVGRWVALYAPMPRLTTFLAVGREIFLVEFALL